MEEYIFFAIFILILLTYFGIRAYFRHRRTEAIKIVAAQIGFEFIENTEFLGDNNKDIPKATWNFNLFSKGRNREVRNLICTEREQAIIFMFDYEYRTGSGKSSRTHYQTVILFKSKTLKLPRFSLVPENLLHKIGQIFGYHDIDFAEYPQFSKKYLLRGDLEEEIRQLFDYRIISCYESRNEVSTEGSGKLLIYYYNKSQDPQNWKSFLQEGLEVYRWFKASSQKQG